MKVFIDTNVLIAAAVSDGHCRFLLNRILKEHQASLGEDGLSELRRKLLAKFKQPKQDVDTWERLLRGLCSVQPHQPQPPKVSRDPQDDWVLASALAAKSDCILTGDKDLLILGHYKGIVIIGPTDFLGLAGRFSRGKPKA